MPAPVRAATADDLPAIAATLAAAFVDDPVKRHLTGLEHVPVGRSVPFFDAFTRIQLPHGHVYLADSDVKGAADGAAVWSPPGHWKVPTTDIVRWSPRFIRMYGRRFLPNLKVLMTVEARHPREPHYYLEFIGVHPSSQGSGVGRSLMEPMLERADREGVGLYLENSKERNLAFYGRYGFQPREQLRLPGRNAPTIWLMWRDPR